jgi:AcrR family transcriptional regulator
MCLRRGGYHTTISIDGIARRVGRARTSVYRRWPSKRQSWRTPLSAKWVAARRRTPARCADLTAAVGTLRRARSADRSDRGSPGWWHTWRTTPNWRRSSAAGAGGATPLDARAFARARARGEIRRDVEVEVLLDMLTAPFYYHAPSGTRASLPR